MRKLPILTAVFAAACLAGSASGQTDPYKPQIDQAKQLRLNGDLEQSDRIVSSVLAKSPQNFRANYTKGLIELDQGATATAVSTLNRALVALNGRPAPDATIYNTLGYALMNQGRLDDAAKSFKQGYAAKESLPPASQQKLLNNMSLLYRLKGDQKSAAAYLSLAAAAGSSQARANITKATK